MLRPQPTRRPWMTPGINPAAETDEDNHLRDDVVAMFRESFHEDGLDFLKRGPRTMQERLAYAQRVRPDAHLTAQPALSHVQRRFSDYGVIDRNRYFVGLDRSVYLRDAGSAELAQAATRRGFENAVGGFAPVSFEQALVGVSPQTPARHRPAGHGSAGRLGNVDVPGADAGLWHHAAGVPRLQEEAPETPEQEIERIEKQYRGYVDYGRRHGYDMPADELEHFLEGSGEPFQVDPDWLRSVPSVQEAEATVLTYFTQWLSGERPTETPSEEIKQPLLQLADGQSLQVSSYWERKFRPGFMSAQEREALAAIGQSTLGGTGSFNFRREGDRIHFEGLVDMKLVDQYDWQKGEWGVLPTPDEGFPLVEINRHDDAIKLQERAGAKPFALQSSWQRYVSGSLIARDGQLVLESIDW